MASRAKHPSYVAWRRVVQKDPCAYCNGPGGTADHIVPRDARSGRKENVWGNLTGACRSCNMLKGTLSPLGFMLARSIHHDYLAAREVGSQRTLGSLDIDTLPKHWSDPLGRRGRPLPEAGPLGSLP